MERRTLGHYSWRNHITVDGNTWKYKLMMMVNMRSLHGADIVYKRFPSMKIDDEGT